MKLFIYTYYFFRSVFLRGLLNTLRLLKAENKYEKQFGINTSQFKKSNSNEFYHYQGASYLVLLRILPEVFKQTQEATFFDIGCGMGRALFVAEFCGYKNLIGIDLDEELVTAANLNLKNYKPKNIDSKLSFIKTNALEFSYKNEPTIYFLFNPFSEAVLEKVLEQICSTTSANTWFVYMNPKHAEVFETKKIKLIKEFKTKRYLEAVLCKY